MKRLNRRLCFMVASLVIIIGVGTAIAAAASAPTDTKAILFEAYTNKDSGNGEYWFMFLPYKYERTNYKRFLVSTSPCVNGSTMPPTGIIVSKDAPSTPPSWPYDPNTAFLWTTVGLKLGTVVYGTIQTADGEYYDVGSAKVRQSHG